LYDFISDFKNLEAKRSVENRKRKMQEGDHADLPTPAAEEESIGSEYVLNNNATVTLLFDNLGTRSWSRSSKRRHCRGLLHWRLQNIKKLGNYIYFSCMYY
jgi:hypothetical protein